MTHSLIKSLTKPCYGSLIFAVFILTGCFPEFPLSTNPLYTPDDITYHSDLLGQWELPDTSIRLHFKKRGKERYWVNYQTPHSSQSYKAALTSISGHLFLDVVIDTIKPSEQIKFFLELSGDSLPPRENLPEPRSLHVMFKVDIQNDQLTVETLDKMWLIKQLTEDQIDMKYALISGEGENKILVLKEPTPQLRTFIKQYTVERDSLLKSELVFQRRK